MTQLPFGLDRAHAREAEFEFVHDDACPHRRC
jgi:hypothetical protein